MSEGRIMLKATFAVLRQVLLDLGFTMRVGADYVRFDHAETKSWFLYPLYADDEDVYPGELVAARYALDMKGLMTREQFEERLRQKVSAG
jgi:nitrate reductase beta subunit